MEEIPPWSLDSVFFLDSFPCLLDPVVQLGLPVSASSGASTSVTMVVKGVGAALTAGLVSSAAVEERTRCCAQ